MVVVAEYTADELTDDSDDEERLEKAEKAAEREAGLKKRKRVQPAASPPAPPAVCAVRRLCIPAAAAAAAIILVPGVQAHWPTGSAGGGSMLCVWGDGALEDILPQDAVPREEVVSFPHADA